MYVFLEFIGNEKYYVYDIKFKGMRCLCSIDVYFIGVCFVWKLVFYMRIYLCDVKVCMNKFIVVNNYCRFLFYVR